MLHKKVNTGSLKASEESITPLYSRHALTGTVARYDFPETEMLPQTAYNLVHDELMLDGNARLNLATFVTTWMEPEASALMAETFDKNMIDKDEYPQTAELELRCVNMLARLWNSLDHEEAVGCSTIGSSEAAMLGGLALKWKWRARMKAANRPADRPNLVMGSNVQVCWDKFCRYFDVEPRLVPVAQARYHLTAEEAINFCDENTIGVVAIMGSTYDGSYEPVKQINDALDTLHREKGWDIPIHVDAASGGFIAPFLQPDLVWDFRVPRVQSINASGHKYGLVYPGVGWIIWRNQDALPEELVFKVNYLGGEMLTFALNFSRPGSQVVAQYYTFLRLGYDGYRRVQQSCQDVALYLSGEIGKLGPFELLTDGRDIPVFAFKLKEATNYTVFDLSARLRDRGWILPAYTFPPHLEELAVLRVVVKDGFSHDMANMLLDDVRRHLKFFASQPGYMPTRTGGGNNHGISYQKKAVSEGHPHDLSTGTAPNERTMALAHDDQKISLEGYFQWIESHPGIRYEYLDGTITMMMGGTARHALIGSNLNRILGNLLEGSPCLVYSSDSYVQVTETACVCPDLTISCDPRDRDDLEDEGELKIIQYPRIVVEVLSPGTEAKDRGIKAEHYQSCSTMQEFLLVDTQTPKIQLYRRTPGNLWTIQFFRLHDEIELKSLGVAFSVAGVYTNT